MPNVYGSCGIDLTDTSETAVSRMAEAGRLYPALFRGIIREWGGNVCEGGLNLGLHPCDWNRVAPILATFGMSHLPDEIRPLSADETSIRGLLPSGTLIVSFTDGDEWPGRLSLLWFTDQYNADDAFGSSAVAALLNQ